jgi:hypothetical protein
LLALCFDFTWNQKKHVSLLQKSLKFGSYSAAHKRDIGGDHSSGSYHNGDLLTATDVEISRNNAPPFRPGHLVALNSAAEGVWEKRLFVIRLS